MRRNRPSKLVGIAALAAMAIASADAEGGADVPACARHAERAQELRNAGQLSSAREHLVACAVEACPSLIRKDCSEWLAQVEANLPTVVIDARAQDGHDVLGVRVLIDGKVATESFNGAAIAVDPGVRLFRVEAGGKRAVEETLMVREGEKNRVVMVTLADAPKAPAVAHESLPPAGTVSPEPPSSPVAAYLAAGLGALAIGAFAVAAIKGVSDYETLSAQCGGSCPEDRISPVRTELRVADIALVVGVLSSSIAAYLFVSHRRRGPAAVLAPRPLTVWF